GVLLRDQVHHHHDNQGMWNPVCQDRDRCGHAGQREAERGAAPPRRRGELTPKEASQGSGTHRAVARTVATAEAPIRNESSGSSTLIRTGNRAASRIQSRERSTRGRPWTLVPFSGSTAQPRPTTVPWKCRPGWDCRYRSTAAPSGMCRSWVSRKLATTYQVRVSTRVNTSTPDRAKAPFEMFKLTTFPVKGAVTRQ